MRRAFLISILLVLNYSLLIPNNTNAQDWTACYNGMFNGAYGVQSIEKCNNWYKHTLRYARASLLRANFIEDNVTF